ncbi:HAD family hydrolase [Shewanella sp. VB17]|uniref:HAD family hydrolase n=1 Tax=Shewanella sp. VB17 TaxID=2739432 RepID=UPI001563A07E|nr:HAD-IA family hydrolase [Shewanella sp. VB17]NRD72661.1 HAD family hydrolase [Shewanella sp. VB17]
MLIHKLLGVIFDLDGTLVSSSLNFNHIKKLLSCPNDVDLLDFVDSLAGDQKTIAEANIIEHEVRDAVHTEKLTGTDELLALLTRLDIPCAIVTRNCRQAALIKIESHDIDIPIVISREDHKAKPAPDALLYVGQQWNIPPENLLYVGDYLYDLQAAQNAKTMSCLVTHGQTPDYAHLANIVVDELTDLSLIISKKYNVNIDNMESTL